MIKDPIWQDSRLSCRRNDCGLSPRGCDKRFDHGYLIKSAELHVTSETPTLFLPRPIFSNMEKYYTFVRASRLYMCLSTLPGTPCVCVCVCVKWLKIFYRSNKIYIRHKFLYIRIFFAYEIFNSFQYNYAWGIYIEKLMLVNFFPFFLYI